MKRIVLLSMICLVAITSTAQSISGCVIDEQAQPMPFANVVLVNRADSAFIAGTVTKDDGTFSISQMQPDTKELGEVVVKGERPQYKMTTGGMTVDIQNSLLKDVGTADDVLSMLPQVQGGDGNFTVFAKGTPEIYINNKKVQNAHELKRLKSTDIKSVDVITSPGAKYNAEVGAVIRIKTKKRQGDGISMEASSQVQYNEKWTTYDDATVKYRTGGLEVFGNMMINNDNYSEDNTLTTDIRANGNHVNIVQVCPSNFWYTILDGQIGASYDFNDENSIGFSYTLSGSLYGRGTAQTQQTITRNNALEGIVGH